MNDKKIKSIFDYSAEELQVEADKIRAEFENDTEFANVRVTDEMHERMRQRIAEYEQNKNS